MTRPVRVLDIATGAGDIPISLWRMARRHNMAIELAGCDLSPRAVEFATRRAEAAGAEVRFFERDVIAAELPEDYDAIVCSLFLHHLADEEAVRMLARMARSSRRLVVVNDLERSTPALLLAYAATRMATRSAIVHVDGPLSVRAAFTVAEAAAIARAAGLDAVRIQRRWPFRFVLNWWRDDRS